MNENKRFELVLNDDGKPIEIKGDYTTITSLKQVVDVLNDLNSTVYYHLDTIKKLESLLEEKVEPTYDDYYLDIDLTTKRCKYENTFICYKCGLFSSYFLDCRLMMENDQYKKALDLGLVKEGDSE